MDYYYWGSVDALNTTKEFGCGPSSMSPDSQLGALEPFASPKEALEALFQNHGYTSWEAPTAAYPTAMEDQASFPPSVFMFSSSPSTYGSTESRSGEAQTTALFDSSLVGQVPDKFDETKLSGDVDYGTLSLPVAKSSIAHELLHDRCMVSALNTLRPVKPIKGMIRKHKQYLTVCYRGLHPLYSHDSNHSNVPEPRHDSPKRLHVLPRAFRTTIGLRPSYTFTLQGSAILVSQSRLSDRPQVHPILPLGRTTTSLGEARRVLGVVL